MSDDEDKPPYRVGKGKPPLEHRFKKNQSGNLKGRPKKPVMGHTSRDLSALLRRTLEDEVELRTKDGVKRVPALDAMVRAMVGKALNGNGPSQRHIFDRLIADGLLLEEERAEFVKELDELERRVRENPDEVSPEFVRKYADLLRGHLRRF